MSKVPQVQRLVLEKNPKSSDAFAEAYLIYSNWVNTEASVEATTQGMCSCFIVAAVASKLRGAWRNLFHTLPIPCPKGAGG